MKTYNQFIKEEVDSEHLHPIYYYHIREMGRPVYHHIEIYPDYSEEKGAHGEKLAEFEGTMDHIHKSLKAFHKANPGKLNKPQIQAVMKRASERYDGLTLNNGTGRKY